MWRLCVRNILSGSHSPSLFRRGKATGDIMKDCGWDYAVKKANCVKEADSKDANVEMGLMPESKVGLAIPLIEVDVEGGQRAVDGTPTNVIDSSEAVISRRPKMVTQQGTNNVGTWELQFKEQERWENACMGWCSSGDPFSNLSLYFNCVEEAKEFALTRGWNCQYPEEESLLKKQKFVKKWYGENFAWKKRTRVSTK